MNASRGESIYLIGCRGAGKSTIASLLSRRLGREFFDSDLELETAAGASIAHVFRTEGESGFREREERIVERLALRPGSVVATGGGCVLRESNRGRLRRTGRIVWLTGRPATLWQRVRTDPETAPRRPDLGAGGQAEIEATLAERSDLYRELADLIIVTDDRPPDDIVDEIVRRLGLQEGTPCTP